MKKLFTFIMLALLLCPTLTWAQDNYTTIVLNANTLTNTIVGDNEEFSEVNFGGCGAFFSKQHAINYNDGKGYLSPSIAIPYGDDETPFQFTWAGENDFDGNDAVLLTPHSTSLVELNSIESFQLQEHVHDGITFSPWNEPTYLPTEEGNYFLTTDVTLSSTWNVPGEVNLCLNGHVIMKNTPGEYSAVIEIGTNPVVATLELYECNSTAQHKFTVGEDGLWTLDEVNGTQSVAGGVITGGTQSGILCYDGGKLFMHGGNIVGNKIGIDGEIHMNDDGGGVKNYGEFTMEGGKVLGNFAMSDGGGVHNAENFTMTGGEIAHNYSKETGGGACNDRNSILTFIGGEIHENVSQEGGGISNNASGVIEMHGGSIYGNKASGLGGGGVGNQGSFTMSGGDIFDNEALSAGGGVGGGVGNIGSVVISGGSIYENRGYRGGGVGSAAYGGDCSLTMTGGTVQHNSAQAGGGVMAAVLSGDYHSSLVMENNVVVKENTALQGGGVMYAGTSFSIGGYVNVVNNVENGVIADDGTLSGGTPNNVHLQNGKYITMADGDNAPQLGMSVGITLGTTDGIGRFTTDNDNAASYKNYFFADRDPEGEEVLVTCPGNYLALHAHGNWYFTGEGSNVINATCENDGCPTTPHTLPSIILNTANKIYDGNPYNATYNPVGPQPDPSSIEEIVFYKRNDPENPIAAPTDKGSYTAKLTVTNQSDGSIATAVKDFDIIDAPEIEPGDYYLYNIASGKWFGAGNEDGFQASLTEAPEFVNITDEYAIKSYITEDGKYFNGSGINSPDPCQLQFCPVINSEGELIYTITSTNGYVYGYDGTTTVLSQNAEGENSYWKIYTKAQLLAGLTETTNQSKDATFLILDPSFGRSNSWLSKWDGGLSNLGSPNDMHASMSGGKFNVYQDLELNLEGSELAIPNGIYELSVQGFYSSTSDKKCACLYANDETMMLKDIASTWPKPATEEAASEAFTKGKYQCAAIRFVVVNNKIRIGVKGIYSDCGWTAFDNFRLTYFGSGQ